jgi:HEAT repeat protein
MRRIIFIFITAAFILQLCSCGAALRKPETPGGDGGAVEESIAPVPASKLVSRGVDAIPELIVALEYPDKWERHIAARTLGGFGGVAKDAVPALIGALHDEDFYVCITAARAIRDIDPDGITSINALIELLGDEDLNVRREVTEVIISMCPQAVPALIEALGRKDLLIRTGAIHILGSVDPTPEVIEALCNLLSEGNIAEIRNAAADALSNFGNEPGVMEVLIGGLKDSEQQVRIKAVEALGRIGPDAIDAVETMIGIIRAETLSQTRAAICEALGKISSGNNVIELLTEALQDEHPSVRIAAARALGNIGPKAIGSLTDALMNDSAGVRAAAAEALGLIGPAARMARSSLLDAWEDNDMGVAIRATVAMARIGPDTENFITTLKLALDENDHRMRVGAATGLVMLGPIARSAVPNLIDALKDDSADVRMTACDALGAIGPPAWRAAPGLIELIEDDTGRVRVAAALALGKVGSSGEVVTALLDALEYEYLDIRFAAVEALGEIGPGAAEAIDVIIQLLEGAKGDNLQTACNALVNIGPEAVPGLIDALDDTHFNIRVGAVTALGKFAADAADALPRLKDMVNGDISRSFILREAVLDAIENIESALQDKESMVEQMGLS